MRIVFADDEADYRAVMTKRLGRRGVDVLPAATGEDALRLLAGPEGATVDVVVLDMHMPGMGGLSALEEIRRQYPDLPVIILTAHADMSAAFAGLECGAFCHLLKPVDIDTLHWRLTDAAQERSLGGTTCHSPTGHADPARKHTGRDDSDQNDSDQNEPDQNDPEMNDPEINDPDMNDSTPANPGPQISDRNNPDQTQAEPHAASADQAVTHAEHPLKKNG